MEFTILSQVIKIRTFLSTTVRLSEETGFCHLSFLHPALFFRTLKVEECTYRLCVCVCVCVCAHVH